MSSKDDQTGQLTCSFCGKPQDEVKKLIAGPTVYICDECIELCNDIIDEESRIDQASEQDVEKLPKPAEINNPRPSRATPSGRSPKKTHPKAVAAIN